MKLEEDQRLVVSFPANKVVMQLVDSVLRFIEFSRRSTCKLLIVMTEMRSHYFSNGYFDWRKAKDQFFAWYFAYYQEEEVDLSKRPDLQGLVTEWMSADELVKHMKLGDLIEFKGTRTGLTLFHHWSVCVRVNNEVEARRRTPRHIRMLHLSRLDRKSMTSIDLFNYGIIFVSAKVRLQSLHDTHMARRCRINNSLDRTWTPFDGKEIAQHALTWRGSARYNGTLWNCEHFVKCCRYGHGESYQTEMIASLVIFCIVVASLFSWVFLPAWISLNFAWGLAVGYYLSLRGSRILEHVIFTFMRSRNIPVSLYNLPLAFTKITFYEFYCLTCFWLAFAGIYCNWLFYILQLLDISLFPTFERRP